MCVMAFIALLHFIMRRTIVLLNNRPIGEPLNEGVGFLVWGTVLFIEKSSHLLVTHILF